MMKAQIIERSQPRRGASSCNFGGPDAYVAVVVRADDMPPLEYRTPLQVERLARRGYRVEVMGEGYSRNDGNRSMLGRAREVAKQRVREIERGGAEE